MAAATNIEEYDAIRQVLQHYIDGAKTGKGALMKPAFHEEATIFGFVGEDLFSGPIQNLFDWNDANGPATGLVSSIVSIDVVGTAASVRVESDDWTGLRFTDFFNLVKFGNEWKVVSKIFHLHS